MNRKSAIAIGMGLVLSAHSNASVFGVSVNDPAVVRVTKVDKEHRRFEYCEDSRVDQKCKLLGGRDFTVRELQEFSKKEYLKAATKTGGDLLLVGGAAALVAAGGYVGGATVAKIMGVVGEAQFAYAIPAAKAGVAVGAVTGIGTALNWLNPATNFANARAVRDDVIEDRDVRVTNVKAFAKKLDSSLNQLDSDDSARALASSAESAR